MTDSIVFYHGLCPDGFGAAFAAWLVLKDTAEYISCKYEEIPKDVTGKRVYILDFSFDPEVMARLDQQSRELVLLDHHATAQNKLRGFKCRYGGLFFDLTKSGARLAWEHFHPNVPVPKMVELIQDRDLWTWEFKESADYLAALDATGFDFHKWEAILRHTDAEAVRFIERGNAMNEKFQALCDSIAEHAMPATLLGHQGLMINASSEFASDVGARLAIRSGAFGMAIRSGAFGMVWKLDSPTTIKISLRSVPKFHVGPLAEQFGGGGHPLSASFRIPLAKLPDLIAGTLQP